MEKKVDKRKKSEWKTNLLENKNKTIGKQNGNHKERRWEGYQTRTV